MPHRKLGGGWAALVLAGSACARVVGPSAPPASATQATSAVVAVAAHPEISVAVHAKDDDADDDRRGTLVIRGDLVDSCGSVRGAHTPSGEENMLWRALVDSVATCMNDGELRGRHVVIGGSSRAQMIAKFILTERGVAAERVELTPSPEAACAGDDCDASELRVEIGVAAPRERASPAAYAAISSGPVNMLRSR
jgi:hypothetical protein